VSVLRLIRTVRHLRATQLAARLRQRLPRRAARAEKTITLRRGNAWIDPPSWRAQTLFGDELRVVGERLDTRKWDALGASALAAYNLHYFDDLSADLITRWIAENPPARGVGWHPYPTSLRIVNWSKWLLRGNEPLPGMLASLSLQADHLAGRIELHLLANHVLANAKALLFAGAVLGIPRFVDAGAKLFTREVAEQILADGGHYERSPMYHAVITEDLLDVENLRRAFELRDAAPLDATIAKMLRWSAATSHPDGEIAFFNDAALGIAPSIADLTRYANALGIAAPATTASSGITLLRESGFVRIARGDAVVIIDAGSVGPSYQPGHAHAGTLSFELSLRGARVIVNSGTSTYEAGTLREFQRSTAAHNTVSFNGQSSSETWASFRVGRRASVRKIEPGEFRLHGCHDGFPIPHCRTFELEHDSLVIADELAVGAVAHLHFAPGAIDRVEVKVDGGRWRRAASTWHPRFGESIANDSLELAFEQPRITTTIRWR
jgi:hypothetical protein